MDPVINEQAILLGGSQTILVVIRNAVFLWLYWHSVSAIIKRRSHETRLTEREMLGYALPSMAWLAVLMIAGVAFSNMQACGRCVAILTTLMNVNALAISGTVQVHDLSAEKLTDSKRLKQQ